jgi:hypothetical protein
MPIAFRMVIILTEKFRGITDRFYVKAHFKKF